MATGTIKQSFNDSSIKYCKMHDGTLICYGAVKFSAATGAGEQQVTDNFPVPFSGQTPYVVVSWYDTYLAKNYFDFLGCLGPETTTSKVTITANRTQTTTGNWYACYIAIGRWK